MDWEDREDKLRKPRKKRYMPVDGKSVFLLRDLAIARDRRVQTDNRLLGPNRPNLPN